MPYNLITILGPTATGKTTVAAHLAAKLNSAVISADSRQVYNNMDIGTGKDLNEYIINTIEVPHYLINILNAGEKYNVFEYQHDFVDAFTQLTANNKIPVLCGGTGLYIESVLKTYQLVAVPINTQLRTKYENYPLDELIALLKTLRPLHNTTDITNRKRLIRAIEIEMYQQNNTLAISSCPKINSLIIGIHFERSIQKQRITERLHARLQQGLVTEVENLLKSGINASDLLYYGLEYKFVTQYLTNQIRYNEMVEKLNIAIHQFSKRQMTWFRKMERNGFNIHWIDGFLPLNEKINLIMQKYNEH